jgi:electron transfer flavoprotein beta subunit
MKSRKKPLETIKSADLGVDLAPRWTTLKVSEPAKRAPGILMSDAASLVDQLRNVARAI